MLADKEKAAENNFMYSQVYRRMDGGAIPERKDYNPKTENGEKTNGK